MYFISIIQNEVSLTIMRVIFQRGGGPIERSYFDFVVCGLCTEAEYIDVTVLVISTVRWVPGDSDTLTWSPTPIKFPPRSMSNFIF